MYKFIYLSKESNKEHETDISCSKQNKIHSQ